MKISYPLSLFLLFLFYAANATTFYVSISDGDDSNDGLSPNSPWNSYQQAMDSTLMPGDSLLFKKGDIWTSVIRSINNSGTAANPIYYGSYAHGNPASDARPIFDNRITLPNSSDPASWTLDNGIWKLKIGSQSPGRLFMNGIEVLKARSRDSVGLVDNVGTLGQWYYRYDTARFDTLQLMPLIIDTVLYDSLYLDWPVNPAMNGNNLVGSFRFTTITLFKSDYVIIDSLEFRGGWGQSFKIDGSDHNVIRNCAFGKYSTSGMAILGASNNNLIVGNIFDSDFTFYYGYGSERGCGDGIILAFDASHNDILNNTFKNWAHNGVELLVFNSSAPGVNNNRIKWNTISAPDIPYAHPFGADGPLGYCQYNEFAYNRVDSCRTAIQVNGNNNHVHHNILTNFFKSPSKKDFTANAFSLGIYGTNLASQDNIFEYNLIMNTDEAAFRVRGYGLGTAKNIIIQNNIIVNAGQTPYNNLYDVGTAFYVGDNNEVDTLVFRNNLVYNTMANAPILYRSISNDYLDLQNFNMLNDSMNIIASNNLAGDPLLNINFFPADNSPAINNGFLQTDTISLDYANQSREVAGKVDIGPIENQMTCSERMTIFVDSSAVGTNSGWRWTDAKTTIYEAVNVCPTVNQKDIWAATGTYYPTAGMDRSLSFRLMDSMDLYGGFSGDEKMSSERSAVNFPTRLSGDIGIKGDTSDNSYHLIYQEEDSMITYFDVILEDGNAADEGGGVWLKKSVVGFNGCIVRNNFGGRYAAAYIEDSQLTFLNCQLMQNFSKVDQDLYFDSNSQVQAIDILLEGGLLNDGLFMLEDSEINLKEVGEEIINNGSLELKETVIVRKEN